IQLKQSDLDRIPRGWLNDTVVEFILKLLWYFELLHNKPELANQIHLFNSFFYKKLS
ncbi:hypothetical protein BDP27DRAFT_1141755, partial [Rhodocollybia butyracea]